MGITILVSEIQLHRQFTTCPENGSSVNGVSPSHEDPPDEKSARAEAHTPVQSWVNI